MSFEAFVRARLPPPPARVLEVGCGAGALARALDAAGYDVLAIDPNAPDGAIFRRVPIEALDEPGPFAAVVAAWSLHHVHDLDAALDKIAALAPLLLLDEFGWDRLDEPTADWYWGQRRAVAAAGGGEAAPPTLDACREDWAAEHEGLHGYDAMRAALDARFEELAFEWRPYLHRLLGGAASEALEEGLLAADAIRPLGFRYAGASRLFAR